MATRQVSVRLDREVEQTINELAKQNGQLRAEYIRMVLTKHCEGRDTFENISKMTSGILTEVRTIGQKLADSVECILVASGNVSKEKAAIWVNEELRGNS